MPGAWHSAQLEGEQVGRMVGQVLAGAGHGAAHLPESFPAALWLAKVVGE